MNHLRYIVISLGRSKTQKITVIFTEAQRGRHNMLCLLKIARQCHYEPTNEDGKDILMHLCPIAIVLFFSLISVMSLSLFSRPLQKYFKPYPSICVIYFLTRMKASLCYRCRWLCFVRNPCFCLFYLFDLSVSSSQSHWPFLFGSLLFSAASLIILAPL